MITITTERQHLQHGQQYFLPYMELQKQTRLNNVAHQPRTSEEYLTALAVNSISDDIAWTVNKKLENRSSGKQKINFSEAEAIVFLFLLYKSPIEQNQFYFLNIRNNFIEQIKQQLKTKGINLPEEKLSVAHPTDLDEWQFEE